MKGVLSCRADILTPYLCMYKRASLLPCVGVCVCLCINTRDELTADSSIIVSLYNRGYSSHRNNPFNLLHLSRHLSLMSDCTKKGWGGLGLGGWNKQLGCAVSLPLTLPPSHWLQGLLWRGVTVSLLTIKANPNF